MTEQKFDERLQQIEQERGRRRDAADAWGDQELARLFNECEWTQEKIARKMGRKQAWVSKRLLFGRFLVFIPAGNKTESLTERAFRKLYSGTRGSEKERFQHVLAKMEDSLPMGHKHLIKKPGYRPALLNILADGKWYTAAQLQTALAETFPDIDMEATTNTIRSTVIRPPAGKMMETKRLGRKCQYRLSGAASRVQSAPPEAVVHLMDEIGPIIDELKHWGRAHEYEMSPVAIRRIAAQLEKLVEPLLSRV